MIHNEYFYHLQQEQYILHVNTYDSQNTFHLDLATWTPLEHVTRFRLEHRTRRHKDINKSNFSQLLSIAGKLINSSPEVGRHLKHCTMKTEHE